MEKTVEPVENHKGSILELVRYHVSIVTITYVKKVMHIGIHVIRINWVETLDNFTRETLDAVEICLKQ